MNVVWSPEAILVYLDIVKYILDHWSESEVNNFQKKTEEIIDNIVLSPYLFPGSDNDNIRKAVISKHTSLFYEVDTSLNTIYLITFWNNYRGPDQLEF